MTVDAAKIGYYSGWDIDQLVAQGSTSVSTGDTVLYTIANAAVPNVFEVYFQPNASVFWYRTGLNSSDGTFANEFLVYAYINGTALHVNVPANGTARYFIWSDKENY